MIHHCRFWWSILCCAYAAAAGFGAVHFELWSQVKYLYDMHVTGRSLLMHPHGMRYLLVSPVYEISDVSGWGPDRVFSVLVALLIVFASKIVADTAAMLADRDVSCRTRIVTAICFMLLSLTMNGRIAFALAGMSLLLHSMVALEFHRIGRFHLILKVIASFLLCSVSSGTFIIVIFIFAAWWCGRFLGRFGTRPIPVPDWWLTAVFALLALGLSPYVSMAIIKNLDFYGGGATATWAMLDHGAGGIFMSLGVLTAVLLAISVLCVVVVIVLVQMLCPPLSLPLWVAIIAMCGGAFGYSTMTMGIPPIAVAALYALRELVHGSLGPPAPSILHREASPAASLPG